jgi:hypothetical protein
MKRYALTIACTVASALLIGLGLTSAGADAQTTTSMPSASDTTVPAATQETSAAASDSSTQPFVRPFAPQPTFGRMPLVPRQYMVLLTRSMFVRGHVAEAGHVGNIVVQQRTPPSLLRAETDLVFNGVTQTSTAIDALVEDTNSGRVLTVRTGDSVARGKVGKITMDALEYIHDGRTTSIQIGQNFTGTAGDVSSSPATSEPANSGVSPQDILEKLRQKRLEELNK